MAPRQDPPAANSRQKSTNARLAYWTALAAPLAKSRGWALLDQFALTAPLAWETLVSDGIHFMMTDAHEALVDEEVSELMGAL